MGKHDNHYNSHFSTFVNRYNQAMSILEQRSRVWSPWRFVRQIEVDQTSMLDVYLG